MSEWFKDNLKSLGQSYRNGSKTVSELPQEEPGFLDKLGDVASDAWKLYKGNMEENMESNPMYNDPDLIGLADSVLNPNQNLAADNNTYLGSLSNAAVGGAAGVVGGIADLLGVETLGDRMASVMENTRDENEVPAGFNWNYITSPHGLARSTGNMLGSMAAIAPASMFMPESAAAGIAARLGGGRVAQFLANRGLTNLSNRFEATLPKAIQWQATAIPEAMAEGGGVVRDARQRGLSDPYGRGWMTAAENLPGLLASNLVEGLTLGGLFKSRPGAGMLRRAATVPMSAGAEGAQNAGEEAYQQFIQNLNTDRPLGEGVADAAAEGFFGSLLLGGLGGATHAIGNGSQEEASETNGLPTGYIASGENSLDGFDSRYISKWESRTGATNLENVRPEVKAAFNGLASEYGDGLTVTGGAEIGFHETGEHGHEGGWKIDVDKASVSDPEKFLALCEKYGFAVGDEGDHYDLSANEQGGTGGTRVVTPKTFISQGELVGGTSSGYDQNFTDKQNEAWQEAQWVESQTGIPAEYIYRQWAHESANFTSRLAMENNNFGGLTQAEPNGEDNKQPDGGNYYREYKDFHDYAQSYVKDFINLYDGKENVKSMEDFVTFLYDNGYFTGDPGDYLASMKGVDVPSTRGGYSRAGGVSSSDTSQTNQPQIDTYDEDMNAMYEGFAKFWQNLSGNQADKDFFGGLFDKDGKFNDTEENIAAIRERVEGDLAEPFQLYRQIAGQKATQEAKPKTEAPKATQEAQKVDAKTDNIDALKEKLKKHRNAAIESKDIDAYQTIEGALRSGDVARMQQVLKSLPSLPEGTVQQSQPKSAQNTPQTQPKSAQTQGQYNTKRYWSGDASPVNHNGKSLYLATPLHSSNLGDSYTQEQIARLGEEAKQFNGSVVDYRGNTAIGFENADDSKRFVEAMNQQTNNGRQEHPIFGQPSQSQMDAAKIKNAYNTGMAPLEGTKEGRKRQGRGLLIAARAAAMKIDKKLADQLQNGNENAIQQVQDMIRSSGLQPTLNGFMPVSPDGLAKATGGMNNESTESATPAPTQGTGNAKNQNQNAEPGQAEEAGKVKSNAVKVFRKKAEKIVDKYRADKITYQKAYDTLKGNLDKALYADSNEDTRNALMSEFDKYTNILDEIRKEKEGNVALKATQEGTSQKQDSASEATQEEPARNETPSQTEPQKGQAESAQNQAQPSKKPAIVRTRTKLHIDGAGVHTEVVSQKEIPVGENTSGFAETKQEEPSKAQGEAKPAQKPNMHFSDLANKLKASGRYVLTKALEQGYKPAGKNVLEAPDGTQYAVSDKAYGIFEKDYQNKQKKEDPKHKKRIYYREKSGSTHYMPTQAYDNSNPYRTDEERLQLLAERGAQVITKEEYDADHTQQATAQMKKFFDEDNLEKIFAWARNNDNVYSIKALSDLMGVQLDKAWKRRKEQLIEYYGDKYTKWQEKVAEDNAEKERNEAAKQEQERQERTEKAEKDWNDGKAISGEDFLLLCDKYDVDVSISTKGVLKNKIGTIKNDGTIYGAKVKKYPQGLASVYTRLKDAMEETAPDEVVDSLFSKGGTKTHTKAEETAESKQEKPLPSSYAERKAELKKDIEEVAQNRDMAGTVEAVRKYLNKVVVAMKADMDELVNNPDISLDLDTYLAGFTDVRNMIEDIMTPGTLSAFDGDQKREIRGRVRDAVEAARAELKAYKNSLSKQEKPAKTENNTVKIDEQRKEAQRFKDRVDKVISEFDEAGPADLFKKKNAAMEKISGYYDDLSPELKDHQQIRGIYEDARIHFDYNEGEHMLSAKEAVLTDKFDKDVDKYVESGLSNEDVIMGAVNDVMAKKSFMGNAMKAIKKNLENMLWDKIKSKALAKDPARYVKYLFTTQPVHTFFDGDESIGTYSPAAVASILINRLKSGVTDIDELFSTKEESSNEQQAESGSPDGGHEGVRTRESRADKREEAGGVSEHDVRKGKGHGSDNVEGHSEEPQSAGVRAGAELDSAASTGTDKRGNQPDVPLTEAQAHPSPTETPGHNYEIKENEGDPNKRNADVRYKQNIDAIKLLRQLEDEERMATPAEQKILAQFNGWGGLTSKFKEGSETDKELRSLLSAEEYRDAQRSSLSAYYTPPKIVKAIWAGLSHLGFKGGRILDPAIGVGNFFGCMPRDIMAKSVLDGVEMESLAARLARQLYPGADVQNTAFQRSNTPKNFYDLVITNVPFEQTIVNGYQVHNYYFAAGIDKVRPGGLMVYITGQGSLASGSDAARMRTYLNKEADLIGAFKLPSGVFDATQVGTDVVVFQKRIDGKKSPNGQDFTEVEQKGTYGNFYGVNQYFTQHRENVLGEMSVGRNRFGDAELNVKYRGTVEDVANELKAAMKKLPKNVYEPVSRNKAKQFNPSETAKRAKADEKTRDREYYYKDGKIVQNQNGQETEIKGKQAEVVESYVKLKNSLNALLAAETDPKATDKQVDGLRNMLNRDYNDFVKKHGYLHGANKRHFADDPSSGMVQSLETPIETEEKTKSGATKKKVTGAKKASIFSERSTNPKKEVTHVDTTSDALVASLNNKGGLDLEYMAKLTGKTQEKILSELKGTVFKDPATENFVTKDEYLSGNVREKLILAKEMAKRDKSYAANVKALEKVQPEDLVPEEIFVSLGTPWIPAQDVNDFVHTIANGKFTVHYNNALAKWTVTGWLNSTKFGTRHIAFDDFLTKVLNGQVIEIKYTDEDKKTHVDEAATKAVTAEAERLQAEFKEWIWKDKERAKRLTDYYNANFNNYVLREYDGSHLDPHEHGMNAKITLKPHQKDAVWRILQSGNTLLAHCVGAGKTFEMQTAGMEMRRLGMANKPMYLVPLNVVDQFAKDFRRLYPGAKLLVLTNDDLPQVKLTKKVTKTDDGRIEITDLTKNMSAKEKERIAKNKAKRARTLARIRTEDWDGIIMSHTLFKELPVSPETQAAYMEEEFKRLEAALKEARQTDSLDGNAERTLEEQKAKLQEKMEEARSVDVKDLGITFEQLGIDQLFVDEADLFKNLHFTSSKTSGNTKIKGITNPQANYKHRAFDMFLKTQWLSKMLNGRGVVFATGTPISNSMAELYTMMRYLDPQGLKEHGTELFDSWIGVFGDIGQDTQLNSTGTNWETVTKVRSYNNRPELLKMFRKFADIKQPSDLPDIKRPDLKGGKPTIIELPVDPTVSRYLKERVPKRIEAMSGGFKKQKGEDNMLALMNDLRNLSLSDSKIEACADTIVSEYKDSTPVKGTQLVFCDLGIPKAASEKEDANDEGPSKKVSEIANPDVYRKLIEKLVKKGIPREQIAFIQDYPKDKRQAVFEKVNNGEIRILIGSTTAMGAGTNCQKHLVALHDLDAPWRPRDLEQRHGRILRQGNENSEVSIYQYALKGSFDAVIWSKLKEKALLIELAMSGDMNSRSMEEADIITLEYSEMVGASLDDPLMKEKVDTENELSKVRNAQTEFSKKVQRAASTLETIDDKIETHQKAVEHIKKDIAGRKSTRGDNFSMTVGNKTFTKRDDAGNAMEARLKDFDESKPTVVGSLGGFALKAVKTITGIEMEVVGKHAYPVKTISVQGIENTVNVQVDDALEKEEAYLEYLNQQKKDALDIHGQENPYTEKVKTIEEKLADLNRQIKERAMEENKKQNDTEAEEAQEEKPSSNRKYSLDGKPIVGVRKYSAAWHGSPHKFDTFTLEAIGTGEGAQAHGWGLYFSKEREVSEGYRNRLTTAAIENGASYNDAVSVDGVRYELTNDGWVNTEDEYYLERNDGLSLALDMFMEHGSNRAISELQDELSESKETEEEGMTPEHSSTQINDAIEALQENDFEELSNGSLLQVEIPDEDVMLDEQKKLVEQSDTVWSGIQAINDFLSEDIGEKIEFEDIKDLTGKEFYDSIVEYFIEMKGRSRTEAPRLASELLNEWGIKGITYIGGRDGRCYVVFDDQAIEIIQRLSVAKGKASKRSMDELKAEVKEAFPGAKVQESGNKLTFTMPNGQKVTVSLQENITVNEQEEAAAKASHGFDQSASVTIEGYAETVGAEGFIALSQGSREGTGFHEAYHIAEAIAFTKRELEAAQRLISENEEERADAYAKWKMERKKGSNFAKLWQKISDVAAKMAGILGFETKHNLFRKVSSGEIYERKNEGMDVERKYSVNPSDNGSRGILHQIKNLFTKNRAANTPEYRRMIKGMMEEIADVKIYYGRLDKESMDKGVMAIYDSYKGIIRARNANDWKNIVPKFGAAVCKKLGIDATEEMNNYVASWILTGAPNNTSHEARDFQKAMRNNPAIREQLLDLQSAFDRWNKLNTMERMQAITSYSTPEKSSISDKLNKVYDEFVEELGPVKRLVENVEKKHGSILKALNPYVAFRLFRGHYGRAITMIEGTEKAIEGLKSHFPRINWDGFKTIHMILKDVGGLNNEKIRKEFESYCLACHLLDIHKENRRISQDIDLLEEKIRRTQDEKEIEKIRADIKALEEQYYETPMSDPECAEIVREYKDKYGESQQDLVHYSNVLLSIVHDSGLINDKKYRNLLMKWPNYVPLFRVFEDNENIEFGDSLKSMVGSSRDVIDPLQSIIRNTFDMVKKAEKNNAKLLLANLARLSDVGKYITEDEAGSKNPHFVVYEGGEKKYFTSDASVIAAINGMGIDNSNLFMRLIRVPSRLARATFTFMNPAFLIRNATRDMQDAFVYNKSGTITPLDFVHGFMHAFRKDEVYWEWMASGAAQASVISLDRDYTEATLNKMTKTNKELLKHPIALLQDILERMAEFSELGTRIASYERVKKHISEKNVAALNSLDLAEAAYESRDLMDFSRGGKSSRAWSSVAIFANASIQGWDKFFRTFDYKNHPKEAMRATARLMFASMLPALVLTLAHWDDDWWKEIPDWQKDSHWILSKNIRIPKGQDIGLRFISSFIEKGLDAMHNGNPLTAKKLLKPVYEQIPDILPSALLPFIEATANYSFFKDAPIVPQYKKDMPAKLQYNGFTSGTAKKLGEMLGYSPAKIDHLIQGYTGSVGSGAAGIVDILAGNKRMDTSIENMPVFSGFMMTPYKNSSTVDNFYKEYRKQLEGHNAFKATGERMDGYSEAQYKRMYNANKKMADLNKKERKLLDDENISPERKKELQAGLQRQRIDLAKRAMGK